LRIYFGLGNFANRAQSLQRQKTSQNNQIHGQ
jgi:hypothetical protein